MLATEAGIWKSKFCAVADSLRAVRSILSQQLTRTESVLPIGDDVFRKLITACFLEERSDPRLDACRLIIRDHPQDRKMGWLLWAEKELLDLRASCLISMQRAEELISDHDGIITNLKQDFEYIMCGVISEFNIKQFPLTDQVSERKPHDKLRSQNDKRDTIRAWREEKQLLRIEKENLKESQERSSRKQRNEQKIQQDEKRAHVLEYTRRRTEDLMQQKADNVRSISQARARRRKQFRENGLLDRLNVSNRTFLEKRGMVPLRREPTTVVPSLGNALFVRIKQMNAVNKASNSVLYFLFLRFWFL